MPLDKTDEINLNYDIAAADNAVESIILKTIVSIHEYLF
jgi:hypothetical protein